MKSLADLKDIIFGVLSFPEMAWLVESVESLKICHDFPLIPYGFPMDSAPENHPAFSVALLRQLQEVIELSEDEVNL